MPIWTVTSSHSIDAVTLTRTMLAQARHDPNVRDTSLTWLHPEGTTRVYTLRVDTGEHLRPASDELWQFLQSNAQSQDQSQDMDLQWAGWVNPLRRNIDYQGSGRRTFLVEELPPGDTPLLNRTIVGFSRLMENSPRVDPEVARQILDQYINSDQTEVRRSLGSSMSSAIRRNLDSTRLARSLMPVQQLPEGALPYFNMMPDIGPEGVSRNEITVLGQDRPPWLVEGVWVQNSDTGLIGQVIVVEHYQRANRGDWSVHLNTWPTRIREVIPDLIGFDRNWSQIPDPRPDGLPWWDRLED